MKESLLAFVFGGVGSLCLFYLNRSFDPVDPVDPVRKKFKGQTAIPHAIFIEHVYRVRAGHTGVIFIQDDRYYDVGHHHHKPVAAIRRNIMNQPDKMIQEKSYLKLAIDAAATLLMFRREPFVMWLKGS